MSLYFKSKRSPVYYIAEIEGNHEGNIHYAEKLSYVLLDTVVDVFKYQLYKGNNLVGKLEFQDRNHFDKIGLNLLVS